MLQVMKAHSATFGKHMATSNKMIFFIAATGHPDQFWLDLCSIFFGEIHSPGRWHHHLYSDGMVFQP